jgi:hypothetical protein
MTTKRARRYQRGNLQITERRALVREILSRSRRSAEACSTRPTPEIDEKQPRVALDDIVAVLNRNPAHVPGVEPVRRFVEQV